MTEMQENPLHQTDEAEARKQAMRERMAKVRAAKGQAKVGETSKTWNDPANMTDQQREEIAAAMEVPPAAKGQVKVIDASDAGQIADIKEVWRKQKPHHKRANKKAKRAKAVEHKVKPLVSDVDFAGMRHAKLGDANPCAAACGPNCIITGEFCGHPDRGLQAKYQNMPEVKRRYVQAGLYLKRLDNEAEKE